MLTASWVLIQYSPMEGSSVSLCSRSSVPGLAGATAASSASGSAVPEELELWYLDAIDLLLQHSDDYGERAATAIRDQLSVIDE
jgi:hypothetical protein